MIQDDLFGQKEEIERKTFLSYDEISNKTRQTVWYIITENAYHFENEGGLSYRQKVEDLDRLRYQICKHKGISNISKYSDNRTAIREWLTSCTVKDFLQTIEIFIDIRGNTDRSTDWYPRLFNTITEINKTFKINRIGYEIVKGRFVHIGSEFMHEQVIKPTIDLLDSNDFKGPLEEFQKALDYYLNGDYKNTVQEASNSFESTMKSVLTKLNINFNQEGNASLLIGYLKNKKIIPSYMEPLFQSLHTIRNKYSCSHGQGIDPKETEQRYAELSLNLAGTLIIFLITTYQNFEN